MCGDDTKPCAAHSTEEEKVETPATEDAEATPTVEEEKPTEESAQ